MQHAVTVDRTRDRVRRDDLRESYRFDDNGRNSFERITRNLLEFYAHYSGEKLFDHLDEFFWRNFFFLFSSVYAGRIVSTTTGVIRLGQSFGFYECYSGEKLSDHSGEFIGRKQSIFFRLVTCVVQFWRQRAKFISGESTELHPRFTHASWARNQLIIWANFLYGTILLSLTGYYAVPNFTVHINANRLEFYKTEINENDHE